MRQCLTSPEGGYYTTKREGRDQFGKKGDFVTSPEISQVFGELLGIWLVAEWMLQGRKKDGVEIIEVGPGRGTLMDDILRTISTFKALASSIENIYLVEASPSLRTAQKNLLCGEDKALEEVPAGYRCPSKHSNLSITWCEDIRFVPNEPNKTPFIFAHEFFDALPIHAFQSVPPSHSPQKTLQTPTGPISLNNHRPSSSASKPQWRELLVTPTSPTTSPITKITTSTTTSLPQQKTPKEDDFHLTLARASNPSSLLLPTTSPRYKALLNHHPSSTIEISPEAHSYAADFARRIGGHPHSHPNPTTPPSSPTPPAPLKSHPSGAALIIDYGPFHTIPTSTLRGIRNHTLVSPFSTPGEVDLSADVDFCAIVEAALGASEGVECHGPVEQGGWLEECGVRERVRVLVRGMEKREGKGTEGGEVGGGKGLEERKRVLEEAVERLVSRVPGRGMGTLYKVLAIVPERGGKRPVGFGGSIGG
ncbi:hypothetical protein Q9189_003704 [Teloschistes chrysophthalmus]